jgi:GT2 family glycosyltransferase
MPEPLASVVIPAHNEGDNLVDTVECVLENALELPLEVIVVDDGSSDGSGDAVRTRFAACPNVTVVNGEGLGVAGARNFGAHRACGEVLIFLDGHCYTPPGCLQALIQPLDNPAIGMVGPAIGNLSNPQAAAGAGAQWHNPLLDWHWLPVSGQDTFPVPLIIGCCQAVRRADFERLGGFDAGLTRWGSEDFELALRIWLMGFEVVSQPSARVYHLFRGKHPYAVSHEDVIYNRLRMGLLHFSDARCAHIIDAHRGYPGFSNAMIRLLNSDTMEQRRRLFQMRQRDDDWYFGRFGDVV